MHKICKLLVHQIKNSFFIKLFFIYQTSTRIFLSIFAILREEIELADLPLSLFYGFVNDIITCSFALCIILTLNIIFYYPLKFSKVRTFLITVGFILLNILLLLNMFSEIIFWDEFSSRYNFIAVDYLIYTNEIIGTLKESMLVEIVIGVLIVLILVITFFSRNYIVEQSLERKSFKCLFIVSVIAAFMFYRFYDSEKIILSKNNFVREIAKNGEYEFVYAFFNNELDYKKFYPLINMHEADQIVRSLVIQDGDEFTSTTGIERLVYGKSRLLKNIKNPNIVVIVVESLSAEYLGVFGNNQNLTPYLDKLSEESVFFTKAYATGTRTVRGLEAIVKSIPPTPGSSILRRANNENLYTISTVLKPLGYNIDFVFGGYSYFDNMKYFFSNNNFNITDRSDFTDSEVSFANVWGISDGDALTKFAKVLDKRFEEKKPFFSLFLTTTNHRPYTFPSNVINMPQGRRSSVVRYTDYVIGEFIENAKLKPWFDDTIFVIVADHCASSAGRTKLPVKKYHIPIFIYAPKLLKPMVVDYIVSQIDILPTVLGLSGINYVSNFYGIDALKSKPNRAFIGTYQLLGYIENDELAILSPNKKPYIENIISGREVNTSPIDIEIKAISFYLEAYESFKKEQESK